MNREFRQQLALAVAQNVNLGGHPHEAAQSAAMFLDAFEKFDDLHELRYELEVLKGTQDAIEASIEAKTFRDILPTVMTFKAMMKTGASSSVLINMLAKFDVILKNIKGPADVDLEDAKKLHTYFKETREKLTGEIIDLDVQAQLMVQEAKALHGGASKLPQPR